MLSFSKFAVFSVLLSPFFVVSSAQGPSVHIKPVGIEKVMAQLTKVKEEDRPKMVALFESFVHEWASHGHLRIESGRLEDDPSSDHFKIIGELNDRDMRGLQDFIVNKAQEFQYRKVALLGAIKVHYASAEAGQPAEEENPDQRVVKELFEEPLKALSARLSAAYLVLLESSTECLLGVCSDEGLKLLEGMTEVLGAIKKTVDEEKAKFKTEMEAIEPDRDMESLMDKMNSATALEQKKQIHAEAVSALKAKLGPMFEKFLAVIEDNVKATEEFSQKIKNGTMVSSLEAQVENTKSECTALSLGLGLGLGLGLPASFALVLFALFKNGRLSWRSTLDSQA